MSKERQYNQCISSCEQHCPIPSHHILFSLFCSFPKPKQFSVLSDALFMALGPAYQKHMWNMLFGCLDSIPTIPGCTYNISFRKILLESQLCYSARVFCMEYSEVSMTRASCPATYRILNYTSDKAGMKYLLIKQLRLQALRCFDKAHLNKLPFCSFLAMLISDMQTAVLAGFQGSGSLIPLPAPDSVVASITSTETSQFRSIKPVTGRTQP